MASKQLTTGRSFSAADLGDLADLDNFRFTHPALPFEVAGKVFLKSILGLTSAEISLNRLPPNTSMPFHHRHRKNEEIYVFIGGTGEFSIDGQRFPVREGTVVRVAPEGVRCWRNLSGEPLYYIVIQAPAGGYGSDSTIDDGEAVRKPGAWEAD
jgi:mannose-6-phosphate isomerase-like protein (cupin superfamily)